MNCFDCLKSRTDSPDHLKAPTSAALTNTSPSPTPAGQTVIGVTRDSAGPTRRQSRFAHLDEVLKSKKAMAALREYMAAAEQANMLDFLQDVENYRSESDAAVRAKSAQTMFARYLAVTSDDQLSLDAPVRDAVLKRLSDAPNSLFDDAERAILEDVRRDVFPRFLQTPLFEKLAGLA